MRITRGHAIQLEPHLDRLVDSAHALAFTDIPDREALRDAIFETLEANGMTDGVHCRITLTRGRKSTSGMDPRLNVHGPTLIIVPEYKGMVYGDEGIRLVTSAIRRNSPQFLDSHIHHNNLLNNILAKIDANVAGVDDAVMLDDRGFLAETNATNLFVVRKGVLLTPFAHACLPGLTRRFVLDVAERVGLEAREADLSLTELYTAEEAFTTGTMGALAHVTEVDGDASPAVRRGRSRGGCSRLTRTTFSRRPPPSLLMAAAILAAHLDSCPRSPQHSRRPGRRLCQHARQHVPARPYGQPHGCAPGPGI